MATRVTFERVVQDAEAFGSTETKVVSRVFFELGLGGETYSDMYVDIEEPVGGDRSDDALAVGTPQRAVSEGALAAGSFNPTDLDQAAFEEAVRTYYRSLVNSAGFGKHLAKDKGFRTHGDVLGLVQTVEL